MEKATKSLALMALAFLIAMPLFFQHPVQAYTVCLNGTWLSTYYDVRVGDTNIPINITERCINGCDTKQASCNPSDYQAYTGSLGSLGLLGIFIVIIIVAAAIWRLT